MDDLANLMLAPLINPLTNLFALRQTELRFSPETSHTGTIREARQWHVSWTEEGGKK